MYLCVYVYVYVYVYMYMYMYVYIYIYISLYIACMCSLFRLALGNEDWEVSLWERLLLGVGGDFE